MNYTLKQIKYFIAVAKYGSVTTASEHLFISQPAISNAIIQLEESFGVQLLVRHHAKGIDLTPSGKNILRQAVSLIKHADEVDHYAKEQSTALAGPINLGCFVTIAPFYIPKLINLFRDLYPDVNFILHEGNISEIQELLSNGTIDLAFIYDLGGTEKMDLRPLTTLEPKVLLHANHPLAKKKSIELKMLERVPMVLLDLPYSNDYFMSLFASHGFKPLIEHRSKSIEMVRSLVANGSGFSFINLVPETDTCYDGSEVVVRPLNQPSEMLTLATATLSDVRLPRRVEVFLDFCSKSFLEKFN